MAIRMTPEGRGLFAENVVANLFIGSGRQIFHNGAENTDSGFSSSFYKRKENGDRMPYDPRLRQILSKPDFIVECVNGEYDFVEVKFRSVGHLPYNESVETLFDRIDLERHFDSCREFWRPNIILVTNTALESGHFTVLSFPYIEKNASLIKANYCAITDMEQWGINIELVKLYEEFIRKTFQN